MGKTKLQALTELIEKTLADYRHCHNPLASAPLRREIARKIAAEIRSQPRTFGAEVRSQKKGNPKCS